MRTGETLPHAKFCKNWLRRYTNFGKIIPKISNFGYFEAHIFKATTVKFGVRLRTWDTFPIPNFVKKSLNGPAGIALPSGDDAY